jgi:hypothetical protein
VLQGLECDEPTDLELMKNLRTLWCNVLSDGVAGSGAGCAYGPGADEEPAYAGRPGVRGAAGRGGHHRPRAALQPRTGTTPQYSSFETKRLISFLRRSFSLACDVAGMGFGVAMWVCGVA